MKKLMLITIGLALLITAPSFATSLINGGFEMGNFTGWSTYIPPGGSAYVTTSHYAGYITYNTYYPVEGNYFAQLKTDGPGSYTSIQQNFSIAAGAWIEGWALFDAQDYMPFNDNAYVQIWQSGSMIAQPWYRDVSIVGDYGDSPWVKWSWTASTSGTYTLKLGVANAEDSEYDSYALFDAHAVIPEPGAIFLLGSGLIGLGIIRRIRQKKS